jgi:hypothetical protein
MPCPVFARGGQAVFVPIQKRSDVVQGC